MKHHAKTIPDKLRSLMLRKRSNSLSRTPSGMILQPIKKVMLDVVIPVYNEAECLSDNIHTLSKYLNANLRYDYRITIIDNGSTDRTWKIAKSLSRKIPSVHTLHLKEKGRGLALKYAWRRSKANVLAYMDVDLSTDLSSLESLIMPLVQGKAGISIGSRLQKQSDTTRSIGRQFISRAYNGLLHILLTLKISDAQCGFKAIRVDVAQQLLPQVADNAWFFDTELLARAERLNIPISEVPVSWKEDPDSKVKILKTAIDDLKGIHRLRAEFSERTKWEKWSIASILILTLILYGYGALKNDYGNSFYAAAVQAGTHSWKAFFFGSLDASNYITVDKPPFSLWTMEIFTRVFGFHTWSMMLPNVLAGVATVYLVYATVRRWFEANSAILAAGIMALTPVAVLMFGFNNPDAILTLLLTASVYTFVRAMENISPLKWLTLTAILTGCAFNTKMLQGLIVLPILAIVYVCFAKPTFKIRFKHLLIASVPLLLATLWWPVIVTAVPRTDRPYIGSSTNDSIWNLILGYNGVGRLLGTTGGIGGSKGAFPGGAGATGAKGGFRLPKGALDGRLPGGGMGPPAGVHRLAGGAFPQISSIQGRGMAGGGRLAGGSMSGFGGSTGIFRMFNSDFGPNVGWLIPLALVLLLCAIWLYRRAPRMDRKRAAFLIWGGYLLIHIVVFSMVSGIIHPYYVVVMAPAVAALIGMGLPILVDSFKRKQLIGLALPIALVLSGITAYIMLGYDSTWVSWLRPTILGASFIIAVGLVFIMYRNIFGLIKYALIAAAVTVSASPVVYALDTANLVHTGSIPTAGPDTTANIGSNNASSSVEKTLVSYLLRNKGNAKWIVAVSSANDSAPIQISSGLPVMAVGGFNGSDNAISLENFKKLVVEGKLKYYAISKTGSMMGGLRGNSSFFSQEGLSAKFGGAGGGFPGGGLGGGDSNIQKWVESTGTKIVYGGNEYTLYKLRP